MCNTDGIWPHLLTDLFQGVLQACGSKGANVHGGFVFDQWMIFRFWMDTEASLVADHAVGLNFRVLSDFVVGQHPQSRHRGCRDLSQARDESED